MRLLIIILIISINLFSKKVNLNTEILDVHKIDKILNSTPKKFSYDELFGVNYDCKFFNKHWYCISEDTKLIMVKNAYKDTNGKYLIKIYDHKTGKILIEGEREITDKFILSGKWKIYNYKNRKIEYIDFNKTVTLNKQKIIRWAKKQGAKIFTGIENAIYKNKRAWQVNFLSMRVFVDTKSGKILGFKLNDSYHYLKPEIKNQKYKCVNRELKRGTKIYKIEKIFNLLKYTIVR